jgi:hypothetical protein
MMLLMMLNMDDYDYYRMMEVVLGMMMLNMVVRFEDLFDYDDDDDQVEH